MSEQPSPGSSMRFDLNEVAESFPEQAESMLLDRYLVDREASSTRVFRVYEATPAHFHVHCDEHLLVLSGRGTFWMDNDAHPSEFKPGVFLFFQRGTVHAMPEIHEGPVVFLAIDTPRREPSDIVFVDAAQGTPETFIQGAR